MAEDSGPKIHIDSDWKAQAQAEKDRLAAEADERKAKSNAAAAASGGAAGASARPGQPGAGASGMPPASFQTLVSTLATQALFAMGAFPDPRTGQTSPNLDLARHHIDMLGIIEEKTQGNLSEEETDMIASTTYELRSRYIQVANAALAKQ